jgi:SAM-dependent methyltransferase
MAAMDRTETGIKDFWSTHPCGEHVVGTAFRADYTRFFGEYDAHRYEVNPHIIPTLDAIDWRGKRVLEIGLGQGADAEQIIRRGALWSGLDLTAEAVERTITRLRLKGLPFDEIKRGSILASPYAGEQFDMIFSHGVLHHVPDIRTASAEIARMLKPNGELVVVMYARWSWHYLVSIALYSRLTQAAAYLLGRRGGDILGNGYAELIDRVGLAKYLRLRTFTHHNTDGAANPYTKMYGVSDIRRDFPEFAVTRAYKRLSPPAPWLFGMRPPLEHRLGWYLWVHLRRVGAGSARAPSSALRAET